MTDRKIMKNRLYISGMDPKGDIRARENNLGFEVTKFSWCIMLEDPEAKKAVMKQMEGIDRFWLHAPFAELFPCSIDPLSRQVAVTRFKQTVEMAKSLDIKRIVVHGGFVPMIYFPEWYISQSIDFWKEFLENVPEDMVIAVENVMDHSPEMLVEIAKGVDDKRLRLCLDIGHANSFVSNIPPQDWILPMSPYLAHAHIHNNFGDKDIHNPLNEGTIEMEKVLDMLLDLDISLSIETQYSDSSIEWLKEKGYL